MTTGFEPRLAVGVMLGLLAGVALSTGGIALRFVESASGWQILFFRALAFFMMMIVVLLARYRGQAWRATTAVGWRGVGVAVLLGLGAIAYVFAILNTTVANVVVLLSASPILTAVLARVMLGEICDLVTWAAMVAVVYGIGVMFADGLEAGGLLGLSVTLGAVVMYALMLVLMRVDTSIDMLPATALSAPVTLLIAFVMAEGLAVSAHDIAVGVFLGVAQFGLGFMLITMASRHVPAAQVALLSLSEVVLAPLWVWLAIGEVPSRLGLVGGLVVLAAVVAQAGWAVESNRFAHAHSRALARPR